MKNRIITLVLSIIFKPCEIEKICSLLKRERYSIFEDKKIGVEWKRLCNDLYKIEQKFGKE